MHAHAGMYHLVLYPPPPKTISLANHTAGQLSAVGSLNVTMVYNSTLSLTWTPPFTLDITDVNPDINGYCVEATLLSLTVCSLCGINMNEFNYTLPPDSACHTYNFTVVPVNIIGNGTSATVLYSHAKKGIIIIHAEILMVSCFSPKPIGET